jgi:hypothetical protein
MKDGSLSSRLVRLPWTRLEDAWSHRETNFDQLLEGVEPVASTDELAVDDRSGPADEP